MPQQALEFAVCAAYSGAEFANADSSRYPDPVQCHRISETSADSVHNTKCNIVSGTGGGSHCGGRYVIGVAIRIGKTGTIGMNFVFDRRLAGSKFVYQLRVVYARNDNVLDGMRPHIETVFSQLSYAVPI
jgi:hypothetical protein